MSGKPLRSLRLRCRGWNSPKRKSKLGQIPFHRDSDSKPDKKDLAWDRRLSLLVRPHKRCATHSDRIRCSARQYNAPAAHQGSAVVNADRLIRCSSYSATALGSFARSRRTSEYPGAIAVSVHRLHSSAPFDQSDARSNVDCLNSGSRLSSGTEILLLLAGMNPNSDAIRIMISACRFAIEI
jgi:hypothetical protein